MRFSFVFISVLSLISLAVHASPMPAMTVTPVSAGKPGEPDVAISGDPKTREAKKNKAIIDSTLITANSQVEKMQDVLKNPTTAKNKGLIVAAFGQHAYDKNLDKIQATSNKIDSANVKTRLATETVSKGTYAQTNWLEQGKNTNKWKPDSVGYGKTFFDDKSSAKGRAGTMIHEAAHYAGNAADFYDDKKKVITHDPQDKTGYTKKFDLPTTPAEVTADKEYTKVRDKATNMHENAESYAVLASLCAHARRDLHNFRRALQARDHEEVHAILRRGAQSCKLPADYFAKKKAAATAKTPATNAKKLPSASPAKSLKSAGKGAKSPLTRGKTPATLASKAGGRGVKGAKSSLAAGGKAGRTKSPLSAKTAGRGAKGAKSLLAAGGKAGKTKSPLSAKAAGRGAKGAKSLAAGGKTGRTKSPLSAKAAGRGAKGAKSLAAGGKAGKAKSPLSAKAAGRGAKGAKSLAAGGKAGKTKSPLSAKAAGRGVKGAKSLAAGGKAGKAKSPLSAKAAGRGAKGAKSLAAGGKAGKPKSPLSAKSAGRPGVKGAKPSVRKAGKTPTKQAGGQAGKPATRKPTAVPGGAKRTQSKGAQPKPVANTRKPAALVKAPPAKVGATVPAPAKKPAAAAARPPPKGKKQ